MPALLVLATLLFPLATASAADARLEITFNTADAAGVFETTLGHPSAVRIGPGEHSYLVEIKGETVTVNWTRETTIEVGRPPDFKESYTKRRQGVTTGEESFYQAEGVVEGYEDKNNLVVSNNQSTAAGLSTTNLQMRPAENSTWPALTDAPSLQLDVPLKSGATAVFVTNGISSSNGSFSLFLWDGNITVRSLSRTATFRSGNWTEPLATATVHPSPAYYRHHQTLRVDVFNGSLEIESQGRLMEWHADSVEARGMMQAKFTEAEGTIESDGTTRRIPLEHALSLDGDTTLVVTNGTDPQPLRGTIDLRKGVVSQVQTIEFGPTSSPMQQTVNAAPATPEGSTAWWWSALLLIPLALFVAVRLDPPRPDITDVEWAILSGHSRRARRWARRIVRRDPHNPDALFLYGSALLEGNQFDEVIREIEPLATKIRPAARLGVAFILAVAAKRLGQAAKAKKWGREAAVDPELRKRMWEDQAWGPDVLPAPNPVSIAYA